MILAHYFTKNNVWVYLPYNVFTLHINYIFESIKVPQKIWFSIQGCTDINILQMCWYVLSDLFYTSTVCRLFIQKSSYFSCRGLLFLPWYQRRYPVPFIKPVLLQNVNSGTTLVITEKHVAQNNLNDLWWCALEELYCPFITQTFTDLFSVISNKLGILDLLYALQYTYITHFIWVRFIAVHLKSTHPCKIIWAPLNPALLSFSYSSRSSSGGQGGCLQQLRCVCLLAASAQT